MSTVYMRQVPSLHRLLILCSCGGRFSLPSDGYSYKVCNGCGCAIENNYREDGGRRLEIHPPHIWERIQEGRRG